MVVYLTVNAFRRKFIYREDRVETSLDVRFTPLDLNNQSLTDTLEMVTYGLLDFGSQVRPFRSPCKYDFVFNGLNLMLGITGDSIVQYATVRADGSSRYIHFSKLNTYKIDNYFRHGPTSVSVRRFRVDTSQAEDGYLLVDLDVVYEVPVFKANDYRLKHLIDTAKASIIGRYRCQKLSGISDSILHLEERYLDQHSEVINNEEIRLENIRKLLYPE